MISYGTPSEEITFPNKLFLNRISKFSIPLYSKLDIGRCLCNFWIISENIKNYSALRHKAGEKEAQINRSCRIMFNK